MSEITREYVSTVLQDVFREVFSDSSIVLTDKTTADDIPKWDSLEQVKLILSCERRVKVRLRARDINGLGNVGEMVDHLLSAVKKSTNPK